MKMKTTRILASALTLLFLGNAALAADLSRTRPERVGMSSDRLERLDEMLSSYIEADQLAGNAAVVLREGRIVFSTAHGWRDKEAGAEMREDTIFRIASQTKAIVSVGIMILHERGDLDINHPLSRYIPEWTDTKVAQPNDQGGYDVVPANRPITLHQLLTHTAGISYGSGNGAEEWAAAGMTGWYFGHREEVIGDTIARMASLPIQAHPGSRWLYGYNTDILGAVIEKASGQTLEEFLQEEILDPLAMSDTHFYLPREKADRLAVVYKPGENGVEAITEHVGMQAQGQYLDGPRVSFSGGAGLLSTVHDYARFLQMTLNAGELDGERILSRKTIELMTSDHLNGLPYAAGQGFGLGFAVTTDLGARGTLGSEGEYGWGGAYHTTYWVDPAEDLVVVYMTQIIPAGGVDDHSKLRNGVYQAIVD